MMDEVLSGSEGKRISCCDVYGVRRNTSPTLIQVVREALPASFHGMREVVAMLVVEKEPWKWIFIAGTCSLL
jgi:hypothetical protein